jgi:hypothetical protein
MIRSTIIIILSLVLDTGAFLADSINAVALQTSNQENLLTRNDTVFLYGIPTNGNDTKNGKLACAKVVSIILRKAGVRIPILLGVSGIETKLSGWKTVSCSDSLKPGDLVIWKYRFKSNGNRRPGDCSAHIGIYTEKGYFHNSPLSKKPVFNGPSLLGFRFKYALRPPEKP